MSLSLTNVDVVYAGVIQVLRSANLEVPEGKIVVLLGSDDDIASDIGLAAGRARRSDRGRDQAR
jgi:ABC-type arginine transport system ATPase subunit